MQSSIIGPQDEHRRAIVSLALHVANQACAWIEVRVGIDIIAESVY